MRDHLSALLDLAGRSIGRSIALFCDCPPIFCGAGLKRLVRDSRTMIPWAWRSAPLSTQAVDQFAGALRGLLRDSVSLPRLPGNRSRAKGYPTAQPRDQV